MPDYSVPAALCWSAFALKKASNHEKYERHENLAFREFRAFRDFNSFFSSGVGVAWHRYWRSPVIDILAKNVRKIAAVRFFFWQYLVTAVIVPFFQSWGQLTFTEILLLQAWFMVWNFLLEVPTGAIADRFGRRISVALAGIVVACASLVYASFPWLPVFLAGEVLFAMAITLISGADEALVYDSLKALHREAEATHIMSALESWKLAGIILGALGGSLLAGKFGLRAPMFCQCVPAMISTGIALTLVENPNTPSRKRVTSARGYFAIISGGIGHLLHHPSLLRLTLDSISVGTLIWLILWSYQPQLQRSGIPIAVFGVVHAGMCIGQIVLLARQDRIQRLVGGIVPLLRITAILPPLGYALLAATSQPTASVIGILIVSVIGLSRGPLFSGSINRHIPSAERATVLSAISAARTLAVAVVYPIAGVLMDRSLPLAFLIFSIAGLLAAFLGAAPRATIEDRQN